MLGRQLTQFLGDQRQELCGSGRVALLDGGQDLGDFTHRRSREEGRTATEWSITAGPARRYLFGAARRGRPTGGRPLVVAGNAHGKMTPTLLSFRMATPRL
jgi:hypothetical protein